jgi:hypothetical protein
MSKVTDPFLELTELYFQGTRGEDNSQLFAVNVKINTESGQVEFMLYPQRDGWPQNDVTSKEFGALETRMKDFETLLQGIGGVNAYFVQKKGKDARDSGIFSGSPIPPAWAFLAKVPDTDVVSTALKAETAKLKEPKPDAESAYDNAKQRVLGQNGKQPEQK